MSKTLKYKHKTNTVTVLNAAWSTKGDVTVTDDTTYTWPKIEILTMAWVQPISGVISYVPPRVIKFIIISHLLGDVYVHISLTVNKFQSIHGCARFPAPKFLVRHCAVIVQFTVLTSDSHLTLLNVVMVTIETPQTQLIT